jgi:cysteine synthase B
MRSTGASTLVELIGNTPLIRLQRLDSELPGSIELYIKAEWFNPGGSVKDRAAWGIVNDAMERGALAPGGTLLDSSSGNTGIAYAMLGAALGFRVVLCVPKNANQERKRTLVAYGAELVLTDPGEGSDGAIREAHRMVAEHPNAHFYADQYSNDANWQAHYRTTGPELVTQTAGRLTHFVAGLGTSGTCMGTGRYIREKLPNARVIAFQPDSPFHGLEGMKHMETAIVPKIYDPAVPHEDRPCRTEDAYRVARRLGREEGILAGISTGASVSVALGVATELAARGEPGVVVCIGPDGGDRYLSDRFWEEE